MDRLREGRYRAALVVAAVTGLFYMAALAVCIAVLVLALAYLWATRDA